MNRRNFLVSMIFVFTIVSVIPISVLDTTTRTNLLNNFINDCYNEDGGFLDHPHESDIPNIQSTFQALKTLSLLGLLDSVDVDEIGIWINETQNIDGGFPIVENGTSEMDSTYYAIQSMQILGLEPKNNITEWINQCWNSDYGFSSKPNKSSTIWATYNALNALKLLGENITSYNTSQWLISLQNEDSDDNYGAFSADGTYELINTYYTLSALNLTDKLSEINKTAAIDWIIACQNSDPYITSTYGSYSSNPSNMDYAVINCFAAIKSLFLLNITEINLSSPTKDWIIACQNIDSGGFASIKDGESASIANSFYAIEALNLINGLSSMSNTITTGLPFNFSIVWIILIIIAVIVVIFIYIRRKYY
ncbi:MAG: hypothetical protein EU549_00100 [Promethearchaeota archaeon]|nr:MAG: hypothetical protein EU549_00100 [Candidatus Lokiarchaeota archaeon]